MSLGISFHQNWEDGSTVKNDRTAEVVRASHICSAPCVLHHLTVVFSVCARMGHAAYVIFIIWNSISSLDTW